MITNQEQVNFLKFLCRSYDGINRMIVSTKNRLYSMNPDMTKEEVNRYWMLSGTIENKAGTSIRYQGLKTVKGQILRRIEKELDFWPIWTQWMIHIPGIGPAIAGNLILLYYYRFLPSCRECGTILEKIDGTYFCKTCEKSVKGDGNLMFKMELRDFPKISGWWKFMGRHCDDSGKMPKRAKGVISDWSTVGRQVSFQIGDQFNRQKEDHPYKSYLLERKARHEKKNTDREKSWTKGHIHNAARNEAAKLFLSHFWQVARTIDGKPLTEPYICAKNPVHTVIPPFFWDDEQRKAA